MGRSQLQELARLGAGARIAQLQQEITEIRRAFPGLAAAAEAAPQANSRRRRRRRKSNMSAAARKAVSVRMKAYWAKRRAAKAKGK
jgi:hypothetical protein